MLHVVADANVLVSAALARSPQAPSVLTLDAALDGRIELVTSPLLLREVAMVLARPRLQKYLSAEEGGPVPRGPDGTNDPARRSAGASPDRVP